MFNEDIELVELVQREAEVESRSVNGWQTRVWRKQIGRLAGWSSCAETAVDIASSDELMMTR